MDQTNKRGGLVTGISLLLIGIVFLLDNLGIVDIAKAWPVVLIGIGFALLLKYLIKS